MTKFLFLGMPLPEVIRATTERPAALIGLAGEIGTLRPGAIADVAVLEIAPGPATLFDIHGETRAYDRQLRATTTIRAGREMAREPIPTPPPWIRLVDQEAPSATAG